MVKAHGTVTIRCDLDQVWAFLVDSAQIPRWRSDVVTATALSHRGSGGSYREVVRFMGEQSQTFEIVDEVDRERFVVKAVDGLSLRPTQSYAVERVGDDTRVTYDVSLPVRGAFVLLSPLLAWMIPKKWRGYANALRDVLEEPARG